MPKAKSQPKPKPKPKADGKDRVVPLVPKSTLSRYRSQGHDVDTDGKPDPGKIKALRKNKSETRQFNTSGNAEALGWDTRFRKAKAMNAERELAINLGQLIPKKEVERQTFDTVRAVRDYLLNIPNRVAGEITAEIGATSSDTQEKVYQILQREIVQALENFS